MPDKQSSKSTRRIQLSNGSSRKTAWKGPLEGMGWADFAAFMSLLIIVTLLLVGYQFQEIPDYKVGDIADRTIESPVDFTVQDEEATQRKMQEYLRSVPAVFNLDLYRNKRVQSELRSGFGFARRLLTEYRQRLGLAPDAQLPRDEANSLLRELAEALPSFAKGEALRVLLRHNFSAELENQMVDLLQEAMKYPGVAVSRDMLMIYADRGIVLHNTVTGDDEVFNDWMSIRDREQAQDLLRQNEYRLTALVGEEKREIIEFLGNWVVPNVFFDEAETRSREDLAIADAPVLIQIKKGRILVRDGDEITAQHLSIFSELAKHRKSGRPLGQFVGIFLIAGFFLIVSWRAMIQHRIAGRRKRRYYLMFGLILILNLLLAKLVFFVSDTVASSLSRPSLQDPLNFYVIVPLAAGAIQMVLLAGTRLCQIYTVVFAVCIGLMTGQFSMVLYSLVAGFSALYSLRQYRERSAILRTGAIVGLVGIMLTLALQLYFPGFQWQIFGIRGLAAFLGGIFSAMLAAPLLPLFESLFEITTDVRLLELSNLNTPILRRLAVEAPGTYHHSIIVGTLAEAASEAIGANSLLTRVGAYYHDIGKLRKPDYYVENQIYMSNKHEGLSPHMSSLILASHVKDGLAMAEEINLAPKVRELIPQHHGTKLMTFFYQKAKQATEGKERDINEQDFRYPGPKPQSKEAAILMLADQVEAASRTLQDPNPRKIRAMIRRLIQATIEDRQFDECDITTRDLEEITQAFERVISGMYHHRIEYPGFDFNRQVEDEEPASQHIQ